MAFSYTNSKGQTYYLHSKTKLQKSGKTSKLFFFSRELRPTEALDDLPSGYMVSEMKTGLPVLKKA